jgi:acyl carrier protein
MPNYDVATHYAPPRTPIELLLASIWAEVLMVDRVGLHDDFLELGGDSLVGAQVVARIYEQVGTEIPLESLFQRGTIAELVEDYFSD